MSVVHYKFKNSLEYKTIKFDGLSISLGDLKRAIMAQNKTKSGEFDLEIKNAQTNEVYNDDATQIPKNASVITRRIPIGPKGKALTAAERPESPGNLGQKSTEDQAEQNPPVIPLSKLNKVPDLASANASEEDKIAAMMNQAGEEWNPSLYAKARGRYSSLPPRGPVRSGYLCNRCRKPGHWIQSCPTNGDPNYDQKVRRTTGIPKSFLRQADNASQKGALFNTETGQYAVPIVDHHAYEQASVRKRPKDTLTGSVAVEPGRAVPMEYICPICKKVMNNAVVVPCCGDSFCDDCIVSYLLEKEHVCPSCETENVSPDSVVINKLLRQAIIKFRSTYQEALLSATSSPSAHREDDTQPDRPVLAQALAPATTASMTTTENAPSPVAAVTSSSESGQVKLEVSSPSITTQVPTSSSLSLADPTGPKNPETTASTRESVVDSRQPRIPSTELKVTEGYPRMSASLAPLHRSSYVVAGSGMVPHHHQPMVHPVVPSLVPAYAHLAHPTYLPSRPAIPFTALAPDLGPALGGMMTEQEFHRAQLTERGRRKRHSDDETKKKHRSRRRERRKSPKLRRSPSGENEFDFELSTFEAMQRDRLRRRSRSRSWTPSGSSSRSNSSWSHSWSRSKSPSRSYSRSKSRTPVNWDRSRSPSPDDKYTRPVRSDEERKKRKKPEKGLPKKRSKTNIAKDGMSKGPAVPEGEKPATIKPQEKELSEKEVKTSKKKESGKTGKEVKKTAKSLETGKESSVKGGKKVKVDNETTTTTTTNKVKSKQVASKGDDTVEKTKKLEPAKDSSPVQKTEETKRKGDPTVKRKKTTLSNTKGTKDKTEQKRPSKDTKDKTEPKRTSKDTMGKTEPKRTFKGTEDETEPKRTPKDTKDKTEPKRISKDTEDKTQTKRTSKGNNDKTEPKRTVKDTKDKTEPKRISRDTEDKTQPRRTSKDTNDKTEPKRIAKDTKDKTEPKKTSRDTVVKKTDKPKKESSKRKTDSRRSSLDENKESVVKEKSSKEIKKKSSGKHSEVKGGRDEEKAKERATTKKRLEPSDDEDEVETKTKKKEGKKKKQKKLELDIEDQEEKRVSRKRPKEEEEEFSEKSRKKKKKRKHSVEDEDAKEKHKKRKKKKKHRKHKHKKKSKHRGKKEEKSSEAASSMESDVEEQLGTTRNDEGKVVKTVDNKEHVGGESSKSDLEHSESDREKYEGSGSEDAEDRGNGEESVDGGSVQDSDEDSGDDEVHDGDVDMEDGEIMEEQESDEEEVVEEEQEATEEEEEQEGQEEEEREHEDDDGEEEVEVVEGDASDVASNDEVEQDEYEEELDYDEQEDSEVEGENEEELEEEEEMAVEELDENNKAEVDVESGDEAEILGDEELDDDVNDDDVMNDDAMKGGTAHDDVISDDIPGDDVMVDDEVLLRDDGEEGAHSEGEQQGNEELLADDLLVHVDHEETVGERMESDLLLGGTSELGEGLLSEITECNIETASQGESVERQTEIEKEIQDVTSEPNTALETELHHDDTKQTRVELTNETPGGNTEKEIQEDSVECVDVEKTEPTLEYKTNSSDEVDLSQERKTSVNKEKERTSGRQKQTNGIDGGPTVLYTAPVATKLPNFRSYDSGIASLDSLPEPDDPNYTDFGGTPLFPESRRTSTDIIRSLLEYNVEDD